jgi:CBS domain-containing protein
MTTVRQVLNEKGCGVCCVHPDDTVFDAISDMADHNIGSLIVIENDKPVGIITERHYARNVALKGRTSPATPVRDVMETKLLYARPDQTVEECMAIMTEKRVRHLPVLDRGELVGIISIGDLVKTIIKSQEFLIDQLVHFIHA